MSGSVRYEVSRQCATLTLDRPERRNALSDELVSGLSDHLEEAINDDNVRAIVITGEGSAFCAGADLKSGGMRSSDPDDQPFVRLMKRIWEAPKPVIARVNGHAFGGGIGLASACDLVIASEGAKLSFSEVRIGVIPAMISVVVIPKIGIQQAMWLFLTGERFDARRACELGLVHRVVAHDELDAEVDRVLEMIRLGGPQAVRAAKQLVRRVPEMPMDEGFRYTAELVSKLFASDEAREGMTAFAEKRPPEWARRAE